MASEDQNEVGVSAERILADRYLLTELIGRGGMGSVYAAYDEWEQRRVAVKLIKNRRASEGRAWRMFSRELRAVLKLDYPGIVSVYDYGIDDRGLPFFVMEHVPGVALGALETDELRWMDVVDIFEQILETLAYAHARGIVHRDIKPDNFLIAPGDGRPRLKLVDFGIAKLLGEGNLESRSPEKTAETLTELAKGFTLSDATVDTPAYMAPELGLNEVHQIGPQTDLYSVGCMLFEFVAGKRPFDGRNIVSLLFAHCSEPVPTLTRRDGENVPVELERLVRSLLEKNARRRPWCAMDVLDELHRVPDFTLERGSSLDAVESRVLPQLLERTTKPPPAADAPDEVPSSELTRVDDRRPDADAPTLAIGVEDETLLDDSVRPTIPVYRDTTPASDRSGEFDAPAFVTRLGVAALREPKLVGRASEQSWLVEHAREAIRTGQPKLLLLGGRRGVGRRRLARWVAEQFAERGAVKVLRLSFDDSLDEGDVLSEAIRTSLGLGVDDDIAELLPKLPGAAFLSSFSAAARFLDPDAQSASDGRVPLGLIHDLLSMVRRDKPLLMLVDNLEHSVEYGLPTLIESALRRGKDWGWPLLVVATIGDVNPASDETLVGAVEHERAHRADLEPLGVEAGRELLQSLLPLRDEAAERIAEYAGGTPDVMLQMLRALGASGDIYASGGQYWVKPEAWDDLSHVDDVYAAGVDRLLDTLPEEAGRLALLASLVGMEPDVELLEDIISRLDDPMDLPAMVDELLEEGVFVGTERGGVRYSHALMHDAWQATAAERSAYKAWQRAVGRALEQREVSKGRIGLHLYESGEDDAFDFLLEGGRETLENGEYALAAKYLTAARRAAKERDVAPQMQVELGAGLGRLAIRRSNRDLFEAAVESLGAVDGPLASGWSAWVEGAWAVRSGQLDDAHQFFVRAVAELESAESNRDVLRARESLADTLRKAGDYAAAEEEAEHALELAQGIQEHRAVMRLLDLLGFICLETERYEQAAELSGRARALGDKTRDRSELARSLKIRCGALMRLGQLQEAFESGKESLRIFREVGDSVGELSMLNLLAMMRHEDGAFGQARQYAIEALERSRQIGEQSLRARILNNLAHACEELGRYEEARDAYIEALRWSHDSDDLQNEARVCFNLARLVRTRRPEWAVVLIERSRRILADLELPYLSESERVLNELSADLGAGRVEDLLSEYDERLADIRAGA